MTSLQKAIAEHKRRHPEEHQRQRRPSKRRNKRCECRLGHIHASNLESGHCNKLNMMKQGGAIKDFVIQKSFRLYGPKGDYLGSHKPDFYVQGNDGEWYVVESKGFADNVWLRKKKQFEACYPGIPYHVWRF